MNNSSGNMCWKRSVPSFDTFAIYTLLIPVFATFGCVSNALNAFVFMRPSMKLSIFTYLSILSWINSLNCIMILCTSLSRSVFLESLNWIYFDMHVVNALLGTLSGAANWLLAAVTMDRIVYLCNRLPQTLPKFCTRTVARRNVCVIVLMSAFLNCPYYFIFKIGTDGTFCGTNFYKSNIYRIHNWFSFVILGVIPGIFLLIGNIAVIVIFRRWVKKSKSLYNSNGRDNPTIRKRQEYQLKVTITLIIIVFLYICAEIPCNITSRRYVTNLVFGGNVSNIKFEKIQKYEVYFLTLNVVQLNFNVIIYAIIDRYFVMEFFIFLQEIIDLIFLITGFTAIRKCSKKKNENGDVEFTSVSSISRCYDNKIFTIEEGHLNVLKCEMKMMSTIDMKMSRVEGKSGSCYDLRLFELNYGDRKNGRLFQRRSMSY